MPIITYHPDSICIVCYEQLGFTYEPLLKCLSCKRIIHRACLLAMYRKICPVCQSPILYKFGLEASSNISELNSEQNIDESLAILVGIVSRAFNIEYFEALKLFKINNLRPPKSLWERFVVRPPGRKEVMSIFEAWYFNNEKLAYRADNIFQSVNELNNDREKRKKIMLLLRCMLWICITQAYQLAHYSNQQFKFFVERQLLHEFRDALSQEIGRLLTTLLQQNRQILTDLAKMTEVSPEELVRNLNQTNVNTSTTIEWFKNLFQDRTRQQHFNEIFDQDFMSQASIILPANAAIFDVPSIPPKRVDVLEAILNASLRHPLSNLTQYCGYLFWLWVITGAIVFKGSDRSSEEEVSEKDAQITHIFMLIGLLMAVFSWIFRKLHVYTNGLTRSGRQYYAQAIRNAGYIPTLDFTDYRED